MSSVTDEANDADADEAEQLVPVQRLIGNVIAQTYRITRHIGSGGSSHVFETEHVRLGKRFALKLLRPDAGIGRRAQQRFRREARAIARLNSEHVVSVVDCGELDDQTPFLVMELLEGEDLRSLLRREGALPTRRALHIVREACLGLSEVHRAGLVHRDLKPENVFICKRSGGQDWCKILDFGVAKMEASLTTAQGAIVGTVRYMAPEQLANSTDVGKSTDLYALGAILYECLAGRPVQQGDTLQEVMYGVMNRAPVPLAELCPALPEALADVVMRCLAKEPKDRPQTTGELTSLLEITPLSGSRDGAHGTTALEDDVPDLGAGSRRRKYLTRPAAWLAPAAMGCAAGLALAWLAVSDQRDPAQPSGVAASPATTMLAPVAQVESQRPDAIPLATTIPTSPGSLSASPALRASDSSAPATSAVKKLSVAPTTPGARAGASEALSASSKRGASGGTFDEANPYGD